MIFLHIMADYNLQGWLASAKTKKWWIENQNQGIYKYDYLAALFFHSFAWTFMTMLPIWIIEKFETNILLISIFIINTILHCFIDDLKANKNKINLIIDQIFHIAQIIITYAILV